MIIYDHALPFSLERRRHMTQEARERRAAMPNFLHQDSAWQIISTTRSVCQNVQSYLVLLEDVLGPIVNSYFSRK